MCRIEVLCPGAGKLAGNVKTPQKIRGAWGHALGASASQEALQKLPCPWDAPCGYDLFFNEHVKLTEGRGVPKPYVLDIDREGQDMAVRLTLFGIACQWAGEAADALVRALRNGLDFGRERLPLKISGRSIGASEGVETETFGNGVALDFLTPFSMSRDDRDEKGKASKVAKDKRQHSDPASLMTNLAFRLTGLARWHGFGLDYDLDALTAEARSIGSQSDWPNPRHVRYQRRSHIQGRSLNMSGRQGILMMPPMSPMMSAILILGETCHAGAGAALGKGRYHLLLPPA